MKGLRRAGFFLNYLFPQNLNIIQTDSSACLVPYWCKRYHIGCWVGPQPPDRPSLPIHPSLPETPHPPTARQPLAIPSPLISPSLETLSLLKCCATTTAAHVVHSPAVCPIGPFLPGFERKVEKSVVEGEGGEGELSADPSPFPHPQGTVIVCILAQILLSSVKLYYVKLLGRKCMQ